MLYFTVPRVVAVSPQMRLVEDNPSSVSLLDVYKQVKDLNTISCHQILTLYDTVRTFNYTEEEAFGKHYGKGENGGNQHFLPFLKCLLHYPEQKS